MPPQGATPSLPDMLVKVARLQAIQLKHAVSSVHLRPGAHAAHTSQVTLLTSVSPAAGFYGGIGPALVTPMVAGVGPLPGGPF